LFNRPSQHDDRGNGRDGSTSARQAAEALFAPKLERVETFVREAAPIGEAIRKSRVLTIAAATPVAGEGPAAPASAGPPRKSVIPAAHVARIRAWLKYGMTIAQVAETYGITADEAERFLRIA